MKNEEGSPNFGSIQYERKRTLWNNEVIMPRLHDKIEGTEILMETNSVKTTGMLRLSGSVKSSSSVGMLPNERVPAHSEDGASETNSTSKMNRKMIFLFTSLSIFLFAGASFGWGPMQLMLEENGAYHTLCGSENPKSAGVLENVCAAQTSKLLNM